MGQAAAVRDAAHELAVEEAMRLICGPRMEFYGPPHQNLNDIGATWTPYVKRAIDKKGHLDGTDVSMMMVLLKVVRQAGGYHRDSTVDTIGYAQLAEVLNEPEAFDRFVRRAAEEIADETARTAFIARFLGDEAAGLTAVAK